MNGPPQPSALGTPRRRRNGKLQACEPCRRRKLSCDHVFPSCGRCKARVKAEDCVYLAPQQQSSSSGGRKAPVRRVRGVVGENRSDNDEAPPTPNHGTSSNITAVTTSPESRGLPTENSPGYLGFTSFSAVFQETQNSLSLVQGRNTIPSTRTPASEGGASPGSPPANTLSPKALEACLAILRHIPVQEAALPLFLKHANPNDGWIRVAARRLADSLHPAFPELHSHSPANLAAMAQVLTTNTARPWTEENEPDAEKWIGSLCGRGGMRWECVGILLTYWGLATLAENRPVSVSGASGIDVRRAALGFKEAAQGCVELCRGGAQNSLVLYLMYKVAIMESILVGDAAPSFWRNCGENIATATYLGIHAHPSTNAYTPTAASEAQRRLISQVFVVDKVAAAFSGRPPLLSRKYMLTPLPLDLSDETLMADAATIAREVDTLDERGWNGKGECHSATIVRARRLLMVVQDEILEVALGSPLHASTEALLELETRQNSLFAEYPASLRYQADDLRDLSIPGPTLYSKLVIYLEHLQNLFFIARLLVQRGHNSQAALLGVSFEMVSTTLIFWTHMDRLAGIHTDCEWLVMAYAAPAAGVLCNALLPNHQMTAILAVTKSAMIQKLSLLVGFLAWVGPSAPNSDLCRSCKAVIEHVLDLAINGPPVALLSELGEADQVFDLNLNWDVDMGGFFNFDLLDTFDWMKPDSSQGQTS